MKVHTKGRVYAEGCSVCSVTGAIPRRRCVQLLLELTTRSQSNRELLFSFEEGCKQLFGQVVACCGDYSTQVLLPTLSLTALQPLFHPILLLLMLKCNIAMAHARALASGPLNAAVSTHPDVYAQPTFWTCCHQAYTYCHKSYTCCHKSYTCCHKSYACSQSNSLVGCIVWQADVMEILYRAAKQDTLRDGGITFQGQPKVKALFEALVNKSVQVCMH